MDNEWKELYGIIALGKAVEEGMEIETHSFGSWERWNGQIWVAQSWYRARPKQPAMKKVKSLCWRHKDSGQLYWREEWTEGSGLGRYVRFPAGDIEGEVEA